MFLSKDKILSTIRKAKPSILGLAGVNEVINLIAVVFITIATAMGLVTIVTGLAATQPLVVFILTIVVSALFPKILKEEINKKIFLQKLFAIAITVIGTIILTT